MEEKYCRELLCCTWSRWDSMIYLLQRSLFAFSFCEGMEPCLAYKSESCCSSHALWLSQCVQSPASSLPACFCTPLQWARWTWPERSCLCPWGRDISWGRELLWLHPLPLAVEIFPGGTPDWCCKSIRTGWASALLCSAKDWGRQESLVPVSKETWYVMLPYFFWGELELWGWTGESRVPQPQQVQLSG